MKRHAAWVALAVLAVGLAGAPAAFAQGCVTCRTSAASGGAEAARALDHGIVVLLVPTILIFVGVLLYAFRYRNRSQYEPTAENDEADFLFPLPLDEQSFHSRPESRRH